MDSARTVLKLRNDLAEITRLAGELEEFCERNAVPAQALMALNLSLEEIVTNVISYAFDAGGEHTIGVELAIQGDSVHARVEDDGREYDPLQRADPDVDAPLDERGIGGLGVLLVRKLMDDVSYSRVDGKNVLTMRKRVAASA